MVRNNFTVEEERKIDTFRKDIAHTFDPVYSERIKKVMKGINFPGLFFDHIDVKGLDALNDRQTVYFGNHLSHFDYMAAWCEMAKAGYRLPSFVAGKNLDHPWVLGLFGMDFRRHGSIILDRAAFEAGGKDAMLYAVALERVFNSTLDEGRDIFVFPEGGRNYKGHIMPSVKRATFKFLTREDQDLRDLDIVSVATDYSRRVEEGVFPHLKRNGGSFWDMVKYYGLDFGSFAARLVAPHLHDFTPYRCSMSFGEPVPLREIVGEYQPTQRCRALMDHVQRNVQELHAGIRAGLNGKSSTK